MKLKNKSHKKIKNKEIVTKRIKIEIEKKKKRATTSILLEGDIEWKNNYNKMIKKSKE
jgi:hypothetical protein